MLPGLYPDVKLRTACSLKAVLGGHACGLSLGDGACATCTSGAGIWHLVVSTRELDSVQRLSRLAQAADEALDAQADHLTLPRALNVNASIEMV